VRQSEILRDLRQDAYEGLIYLPLDLLDRHATKPEALRAREIDDATRKALRDFRSAAEADLTPADSNTQGGTLRPLFVLAALHRRLLDRIAGRNYDVTSERVDLGPVEKPWVAWRAARRSGRSG
jgi:phytoene synthase